MRARITRMIVVVTATAVFVLAVPLAVAVSRLYQDEAVQNLVDDAARTVATIPVPPDPSADPVEVANTDDGATIGVYGADGARIAGAGPARADAVTMDALHGHVASGSGGAEVVAVIPVGGQEQVVAAVRAALPQSSIDGRIHRAWWIMAAAAVATIIGAAGIAIWQGLRLSRPLDALAHAAELLGGGDFSVRVPPSNVTEIDTVGTALNGTAERLAIVLDRERAFSANASHQLRTPLTALRVRLESALLTPGADARRALERSLEDVDRLDRTVRDMLQLARDAPADRRPVDVAGLLGNAEARWRERVAAVGRPLVVDAQPGLASVHASESAIRQITDVLVDNAIIHGRGTVRVQALPLEGGIAIEVSDEGPGVADDAHRIFQRRRPESAGSGIGLSLARSLAEAEGGRLLVAPRGDGSVFRLVLPALASRS